jgi:small subunit ribosomal protein S1
MPENKNFPPEGLRPPVPFSLPALQDAVQSGEIFEAVAQRCDIGHTLHFSLGGIHGVMPRSETTAPWISGADREIAVLSRVGKSTCFTVTSVSADAKGAPVAQLSRRAAQEKAMDLFLGRLEPGMVLTCRVTRLESFGAFLDIGCGIVALLPIERVSVSRVAHTRDRFREGQKILAAVETIDRERRRVTMTHRELLGTWLENASRFCPGETVRGVVRGVKDYGSFIELAPNLSGLAEDREGLSPGDSVSVYIKSIQPDRMKIKLQIISHLPRPETPEPIQYQITDGQLTHWIYSPPGCTKLVETVFKEDDF